MSNNNNKYSSGAMVPYTTGGRRDDGGRRYEEDGGRRDDGRRNYGYQSKRSISSERDNRSPPTTYSNREVIQIYSDEEERARGYYDNRSRSNSMDERR